MHWQKQKDIEATHEMIPRHCPSIPLQEASLSFHLWPIHQNPRAFLQAKAKNIVHMGKMSECGVFIVGTMGYLKLDVWWLAYIFKFKY